MKPRFVDEMKNITVEVGQDATFTCTVSEIHVRTSSIIHCYESTCLTVNLFISKTRVRTSSIIHCYKRNCLTISLLVALL